MSQVMVDSSPSPALLPAQATPKWTTAGFVLTAMGGNPNQSAFGATVWWEPSRGRNEVMRLQPNWGRWQTNDVYTQTADMCIYVYKCICLISIHLFDLRLDADVYTHMHMYESIGEREREGDLDLRLHLILMLDPTRSTLVGGPRS